MKKLFLFFFLLGLIATAGYSLWNNQKVIENLISPISTQSSLFSMINAPKNSVKGQMTNLIGEIAWQSRVSSQSMVIKKPVEIQQGESLQSGKDGKSTVLFENYVVVDISSNSDLEFIQTLPNNFVFNQKEGNVSYEQIGSTPLSVRTLHSIVKINSGSVAISVDIEKGTVDLTVKKGTVTIGYNDINFVSQVIPVSVGQELIYNDKSREAVFN